MWGGSICDPDFLSKGCRVFFLYMATNLNTGTGAGTATAAQADGKFHEGDCYILLATTETPGRLTQATHFWLGSECSQARREGGQARPGQASPPPVKAKAA